MQLIQLPQLAGRKKRKSLASGLAAMFVFEVRAQLVFVGG